jgi:hypothetical protein
VRSFLKIFETIIFDIQMKSKSKRLFMLSLLNKNNTKVKNIRSLNTLI